MRYETAVDKANEVEIIEIIEDRLFKLGWGTIHKVPARYANIDSWGWKKANPPDKRLLIPNPNKVFGGFEIKNKQGFDFSSKLDPWISITKANALIRSDEMGIPAFLIYRDKNLRIQWARIKFDCIKRYEIEWGGRTDRDDPMDRQLFFKIPRAEWFTMDVFPHIDSIK